MSWLKYLPMVLSGASTLSSYDAAKKEGAFEASALRTNAAYADKQADDSKVRGQSSAMSAAVKARMMVGSQRVALAAQGIDISSGSALDVQADTGKLSELDIMTIRNDAAREAWGFKVQASDYRGRAKLTETAASNKGRTTLLTGGLEMLRLFK